MNLLAGVCPKALGDAPDWYTGLRPASHRERDVKDLVTAGILTHAQELHGVIAGPRAIV